MRRWFLLAVLAVFFSGCQSITHPPQAKKAEPAFAPNVPNGEASPFGP
jgi:hypothetical protein